MWAGMNDFKSISSAQLPCLTVDGVDSFLKYQQTFDLHLPCSTC